MNEPQNQRIQHALDQFRIETPSWGFADTGTRFGKFLQDAAAIDINDKLADAGQVHAFTGFVLLSPFMSSGILAPTNHRPRSCNLLRIRGPHRGD